LLGITPDATPEQVKAAYDAAFKAADGPGLDFVRKAAEKAYAVVGNATARAGYDPAWAGTAEPSHPYRSSEDDVYPALPRVHSPSRSPGWVGSEGDEAPGDYQYAHDRSRDPKGYYALLEVSADASLAQIVSAYRLKFNWSYSGSMNASQVSAGKEAYAVLSDPILRSKYDPAWSSRPAHSTLVLPRFAPPRPLLQKSAGCLGLVIFVYCLILFSV
jgi:hypothetical protein